MIGQSLEAGRIDAAVLDGALVRRLAPANKSVVAKTMMRRFRIDDPAIVDEGYQDLLTSIERKPLPSLEALRNIRRLMPRIIPRRQTVKVEELIDARIIRKLDENGYMDRVAASYGLK